MFIVNVEGHFTQCYLAPNSAKLVTIDRIADRVISFYLNLLGFTYLLNLLDKQ